MSIIEFCFIVCAFAVLAMVLVAYWPIPKPDHRIPSLSFMPGVILMDPDGRAWEVVSVFSTGAGRTYELVSRDGLCHTEFLPAIDVETWARRVR